MTYQLIIVLIRLCFFNFRQALYSAKEQQDANLGYERNLSHKKFLFFEKEQLHEECLHLKSQVNEIEEYNIVLQKPEIVPSK